ncbi:MAG TPA: bifunctional glycosyltransferase family 2/GtrA family protein [Actinomycetes bacterium]
MTTTTEPAAVRAADSPRPTPAIDLVVPVYNEETNLEPSVRRLHAYLSDGFPFSFRITIADNASTDHTWQVAQRLQAMLPHVRAVHLDEKGRGRALRQVWSHSDATVLVYMDVDLSTDLAALLPLVAPVLSGHSDVAIGTRLTPSSRVVRGPKRELISRTYNLILRTTLGARFSDAQCGFKAIRADRAAELLPMVEDTQWFFDTELLVLAERSGLRIHEVPVDWVDDPDSRVDIVSTAVADLKGIARLGRALATGRLPLRALRETADAEASVRAPADIVSQLVRFAVIGVASTVAYLLLYLLLGGALSAQWANALALVTTAVLNTAANRRLTFGVSVRAGRRRHQAQGLVVFGIGLALTSGSLALLQGLAPNAGRLFEVTVLVAANVAATLVRFLLFRSWMFRRPTTSAPAPHTELRTARDHRRDDHPGAAARRAARRSGRRPSAADTVRAAR